MEREEVVELVIAIGGVALFVAALAFVGAQYGAGGVIQQSGRIAVLGAITLFIVVMGLAGLYLAERD